MSEDSLLNEVDEELRRDRMRELWRRFGPYVIGGAIAVVVLVGVNEGWRWWQDSNAARSSDLLYAAFDAAGTGNMAAASQALDTTIAEGTGDYPLLASFRKAAMLAQDGKADEAVAAYDAISNSTDLQRLRELALVLAAYQLVDKGDVAGVTARIGGIVASGSALRNSAREALGLAQYKAGEGQAAADTFEAISLDPGAAPQQVGRMRVYLAQLSADGIVPTSQIASVTAPSDTAEPAAAGN